MPLGLRLMMRAFRVSRQPPDALCRSCRRPAGRTVAIVQCRLAARVASFRRREGMVRTTPFHERTSALNETGLWEHWANYLAATKYQMSEKFEYVAVRNAVGLFDTSPLYKYRFSGPDAECFLAGVLARDPRSCAPGHAQYTLWCDDRGFV